MPRGPRSAVLGALAVAAAAAAFLVLRPDDAPTAATPAATVTAETGSGPAAAEPPVAPAPTPPLVRVTDGQPVGGVMELSARRGETVRFAVVSDASEEVHVHGYDHLRDLAPGEVAQLTFPADLEGVFEVELHTSGALIAELTVSP